MIEMINDVDIKELRKHAKEITLECEKRGYGLKDTILLATVLKNEIEQCEKAMKKLAFQALP